MIYFLTGPNSYKRHQKLAELINNFTEAYGAHGIERYDGEKLAPQQLSEIMQAASLFAQNRLVILRDISANKSIWEFLGENLDLVDDTTQLVVVEPAADKRTKAYKQLQKQAEVIECNEPAENELQGWVGKELSVDGSIARHLVEKVGADQQRLSSEIAKLAEHEQITKELIDDLVVPSTVSNVFALLDAIFAHRPADTKAWIDKLRQNEDPYLLFGLLAKQIFVFAVLFAAKQDKINDVQVAKDFKLSPYTIKKLSGAVRSADKAQVASMCEEIAKCDTKIKSTGADPWLLLESTCVRLASK